MLAEFHTYEDNIKWGKCNTKSTFLRIM